MSMASDLKKSVEALSRTAIAAGWTVERRKAGHVRFLPADPTKPVVFSSSTPGDYRGLKNLIAQLRRSGLDI